MEEIGVRDTWIELVKEDSSQLNKIGSIVGDDTAKEIFTAAQTS